MTFFPTVARHICRIVVVISGLGLNLFEGDIQGVNPRVSFHNSTPCLWYTGFRNANHPNTSSSFHNSTPCVWYTGFRNANHPNTSSNQNVAIIIPREKNPRAGRHAFLTSWSLKTGGFPTRPPKEVMSWWQLQLSEANYKHLNAESDSDHLYFSSEHSTTCRSHLNH